MRLFNHNREYAGERLSGRCLTGVMVLALLLTALAGCNAGSIATTTNGAGSTATVSFTETQTETVSVPITTTVTETSTPAPSGPPATTPVTGTPVPSSQPTVTTTSPAAGSFGQAAIAGETVFASNCAVCHGSQGQGGLGPALLGVAVEFSDYGTADRLLGFISTRMPQSAPGALSTQQYLDVTAFILVENNIVWEGHPFSHEAFSGILLPD